MNAKDLQELKEMTGLVSESELANINNEVVEKPRCSYDRQPFNRDLVGYVGAFVKVGNNYGIIDDVHRDMLGFVHCEKDTWTGELVSEADIEYCKTHDDVRKAHASALEYFRREHESLYYRMKMAYKFDNQVVLSHLLWKVDKWLEKLGKMAA